MVFVSVAVAPTPPSSNDTQERDVTDGARSDKMNTWMYTHIHAYTHKQCVRPLDARAATGESDAEEEEEEEEEAALADVNENEDDVAPCTSSLTACPS
jgi:hypothetical protein